MEDKNKELQEKIMESIDATKIFDAIDESGDINWHIATSTAAAHSPEFSGGTWKLPSRDDWKNMFKTYGGNDSNYAGLNTAITGAGGTGLLAYKGYWTSTESSSAYSYCLNTANNCNINFVECMKSNSRYVRVCLEF